MKKLILMTLLSALNLNAQVVSYSQTGLYDTSLVEKATRGAVVVSKGSKSEEELRLVCIKEIEVAGNKNCETYNFFVSAKKDSHGRIIEEGKMVGRLVTSFPVAHASLVSKNELKESMKKNNGDLNNDLNEFKSSYGVPAAIALFPLLIVQGTGKPGYVFLMPVSFSLGLVALLPSTLYFSISSIAVKAKLNKYIKTIVENEKNKKIKLRKSSFISLSNNLDRKY